MLEKENNNVSTFMEREDYTILSLFKHVTTCMPNEAS